MAGGDQAYVLVRDWLGEAGPVDRDTALAELARRYLSGHGPATTATSPDGAACRSATRGPASAAIASELDQRGDGLVDLANRPAAAKLPPPRLLGAFDPVLLGWTSRREVVGEHQAAITAGGVFRAFALVRGRAAATWTMRGGRGRARAAAPALPRRRQRARKEAADVVRFLGAA